MSTDIRALLERERHGVLATLSARRQGWPFASVAPYALTDRGEPLLLLSDLAEHTRNLRSDPRASLIVVDSNSSGDPLSGSRVTLLGRVTAVSHEDQASARERYVSRYTQANRYLTMSDFKFYVLNVTEARYVSGFGDMGWLEGEKLRSALI
jgi:putative heme iron utilization protein